MHFVLNDSFGCKLEWEGVSVEILKTKDVDSETEDNKQAQFNFSEVFKKSKAVLSLVSSCCTKDNL